VKACEVLPVSRLVSRRDRRQSVLPACYLTQTEMLSKFARTRLPGGSNHDIRKLTSTSVGSAVTHRRIWFPHPSRRRLSLFDTRRDSPNRR